MSEVVSSLTLNQGLKFHLNQEQQMKHRFSRTCEKQPVRVQLPSVLGMRAWLYVREEAAVDQWFDLKLKWSGVS